MNVLLLSSRFPWPAHTGDRLRAAIWIAALQRTGRVALVSPAGVLPDEASGVRFHPVRRSVAAGLRAVAAVAGGAPVTSLLAAPFDWSGAIAHAKRDLGRIDATVVLLSRLDPWVRASLPAGRRILDAIDSLQRSMIERSRHASPLGRWFWHAESRRVALVEREAAQVYDEITAVSQEDATDLGARVVSNGVALAPLGAEPRPFDFGFWGRLPYFANADAVAWLLEEIWPAVRAARPNATLVIAGAAASQQLLGRDGRDGIAVRSPVGDMAALARQVRVALIPMRYGTGQSNKVLEAGEAGCAIVATAHAMRGFAPLAPYAWIAEDTPSLVRACVEAFDARERCAASGLALRHAVEVSYSRTATLDAMVSLVAGAEEAA